MKTKISLIVAATLLALFTVVKSKNPTEILLDIHTVELEEEPLELQDWMINDKLWNMEDGILIGEIEENAEVEDWIVDRNN